MFFEEIFVRTGNLTLHEEVDNAVLGWSGPAPQLSDIVDLLVSKVPINLVSLLTWIALYRLTPRKDDECEIIAMLKSRLDAGRKQYGPWKISDDRDYSAEALEEVLDALHYVAAGLLRFKNDPKKLRN